MIFRAIAIALWTSLWLIDPSISASEYPSRSIRLVVPYPAGGTTDVMARAMQEPLAKLLGQPIVIDNKSGAAGTLGAAEVARSNPDGYTLLFSNDGPSVIAPLLQKQRPFDPIESFTPISLVSTQPLVLVVNSELPVKDIPDFVLYAKKQSKPVLYGTAGPGSLGHLATMLFAKMADISVLHVPYRGAAPSTQAVMTGEVSMLLTTSSPAMGEFIETGKLKLLGASTRHPEKLPAGTPLISSTYPDFKEDIWFGILGPRNLPSEITLRLNEAITKTLANPAVAKTFQDAGFILATGSADELKSLISNGVTKWRRVISENGITLE